MAQPRKPIPKSQAAISAEKQSPFSGIEGRGAVGNPNDADINVNSNYQATGIDFNRSEQMSYKGDDTKQFSVGIQDIDEAVFYYFQNVIKPFVYQNGERREVPIIYGSPERWKSVQRDGYYRDVNGRIMAPLIMYKRTSIDRNRGMTSKVDSNFPQTYAIFQQKYTKQNFYNQLSVLNGATPIKTYQAIVIPDFVTLSYSCMIYTYYMEQLNKIVEAINYAADSYWGDPQRFKFKANIGSYQTITELNVGQQRTVRGSFEIKLNGYIIPDVIQKDLNAIKKYSSTSQVNISSENIENLGRTSANNFIEDINTNL